MEEIERIDGKELAKQIEEEIQEGDYVEVGIIVGKGKYPLCKFEREGVGKKEIGKLYKCLDNVKEMIEKRYPEAVEYAEEELRLTSETYLYEGEEEDEWRIRNRCTRKIN